MSDARRSAARLLCVGVAGPELSRDEREVIAAGVGFVVLFARNVRSPAQVAGLIAEIKSLGEVAGDVAVCVDQEGGRVQRLRDGFTPLPPPRSIGERGTADDARAIGQILATECRAVGVDVAFAPVLDVDTNPLNRVIADRSFGRDPRRVAELGVAMIEGIQRAGVAACGKHFPGHGDTTLDSHVALPRIDHAIERLRAVELVPFAAAARAGASAMMTSHIRFAPLDERWPATLSRSILTGLLRDDLGFDGVVFTDDLEMAAIAAHFDFDDAIVRTIAAEADVALVCHSIEKQRRAIGVLADAIEAGWIDVGASHRRIDRLHATFVRPASFEPAKLATAGHHALVAPFLTGDVAADPTRFRD